MVQTIQGTNQRKDREQWFREMEQEVKELLAHSETICQNLFASGDLTAFLALLSRLHQYDARNLLLIYHRLPDARCLGAFADWQKRYPDKSKMILNQKGIKQGIRLLAPYTLCKNGQYSLTWFCVRQYDISQTNLSYTPPSTAPYVMDDLHLTHLAEAVRAVLSYSFQKSLLLVPKHHSELPSQLPFRITEEAVEIRSTESALTRLLYLTEACAMLFAKQESLPSSMHTLFSQCVSHCLFLIWQHPKAAPAPANSRRISSVAQDMQFPFLNALQRAVRELEEAVACAYGILRDEDKSDPMDGEDISALLGFQSGIDLSQ